MSMDETSVVHVEQLEVDYGQTYLVDDECSSAGEFNGVPSDPAGIVRVEKGKALLFVGLQYGTVGFTVAVADRDPGADLEGYEDIVEIGFDSPSGRVSLEEWGGARAHTLPPLSAGPGTYRLRYHARGMDEESYETVTEHYLLQIWPAPPDHPAVLKSTSSSLQRWLDFERSH
ncbi:hypothetical protein ACTMTF_33885 [Nonomuraea sp. ZG12]|uniref:hypothetical protein n=1 Tax=Nonomuraea sp. ZG12 TaxID=3452207 RepID=UPI003F8BEF43